MALKMFRENLKSLKWVLWLVVFIFIGLIFFQWGGVNRAQDVTEEVAAKIGDEVVTYGEFKNAYTVLESNYQQAFGERFDKDMAKQFNLAFQALNQAINAKILLLEARRVGLEVTDDELREAIGRFPVFKDENGRFIGKAEYQAILRRNRLSSDEFEASMRDDLLRSKLSSILQDTVWVSDAEVEAAYREREEKAKIRFVELPASKLDSEVTAETADLETYYAEHQTEYERPEERTVDYLLVDTAKLRQDLEIPDEDLRAYYDEHPDEFERKETVRARHILRRTGPDKPDAEVEAELRDIRRRIEAGEDFAALARELSDDPGSAQRGGTLNPFGRGEMVPEFEEAAFNAEVGSLVGPVKSVHGYHLIEVQGKTPGGAQPFDQVKVIIRSRLVSDRVQEIAEGKARDLSRRIETGQVKNREQLTALADEEGLAVQTTDPFGKDDIITGIGRAPVFNEAAFELASEEISEPVQIPRGWAILRLAEVSPPHVPELSEIEDEVRSAVLDEKKKTMALERLRETRAGLGDDGTLDSLAENLSLEVKDAAEFGRLGSIAGLGSNREVIEAALAMEVGEVGGPFPSAQGAVLFEVVERKAFDPDKFEEAKAETRAEQETERVQQLLSSLIEVRRRDLDIRYMPEVLERFEIQLPAEQG